MRATTKRRKTKRGIKNVLTTLSMYEEAEIYYGRKGSPMRLDDVDECLHNKRSIEQAVGRLVDTDLHIAYRSRTFDCEEDANEFVSKLPQSWETSVVRNYKYVNRWRTDETGHCYCENVKVLNSIFVNYRPRELREIRYEMYKRKNLEVINDDSNIVESYNLTNRDNQGSLRPIIKDWPSLRDAALRFINSKH